MVDFGNLLNKMRDRDAGLTSEKCFIDAETYSASPLPKVGNYKYFEHPTTGVWMLAIAFDDGPVKVWKPGQPVPQALINHIARGGQLWAHNSVFERLLWWKILIPRYGFPEAPLSLWHCTMAHGHLMGLPGSLDNMAAALGLAHRKDAFGHQVMKLLCAPREQLPYCDCGGVLGESQTAMLGCPDPNCRKCGGTGGQYLFWTPDLKPEEHTRLTSYCIVDVEVERELESRQLAMTPFERRVWILDQQINDRGIGVDRRAAAFALKVVDLEKIRLNEKLFKLTNGYVKSFDQRQRIMDWCESQGVTLENLRRTHLEEFLENCDDPEADPDEVHLRVDLTGLPANVRSVLEIRLEGAKPSVKKLEKLLLMVCADGRLRGFLRFSGAHTTRWTSLGVQLQNLPRGRLHLTYEQMEFILNLIATQPAHIACDTITALFGPPLQVISDCIRGFFVAAEGYDLVAPDHVQIELRCQAFQAGDDRTIAASWRGDDLYIVEASAMYHVPMSEISKKDDRRQDGKVCRLAFQYGGGVGAGQNMGTTQGVFKTDQEWETLRDLWRGENREITSFWWNIEEAAKAAVLNPGRSYVVRAANHPDRKITFKVCGSFLIVWLPSGGNICYPYPKVQYLETPWGKMKDTLTYMHSKNGRWIRVRTHGGKLSENFAQKLQRDCLAEGMLKLDAADYPLVVHAHDEAVAEIKKNDPVKSITHACIIFAQVAREWGKDMPVNATGWQGERYRKE